MIVTSKLKKYICLIIAIIILITVTASLLISDTPNKRNKYTINAEFHADTNTILANMNIKFYNNYDQSLDSIMLALYPNAFMHPETAPFEDADIPLAYPNGFSDGSITVDNVTLNGAEAEAQISPTSQQMTISFPKKLKKGGCANISFDFTLKIPNANGRFGYIGNTVNLGNWYPQILIKKDNRWLFTNYTAIGDPFVSETADYEIYFTTPKQYTVIGSAPISNTAYQDKKVWQTKAENIRDFALVISSELNVLSDNSCGTIINCFYKEDAAQARAAVKAATDAIKLFNNIYGAYPFEQFNIVQTSFFIGGMEYPGIVFIDNAYFEKENLHPLENVVVHECAHQWWYASVGNDQINEAWIDEGLATYSTMLYYEKYKDRETHKLYYKYYVSNAYKFHRDDPNVTSNNLSERFTLPLTEYPNSTFYTMICYEKSAMMLQCVRELLGDTLFFEGIKCLYESNTGKIVDANIFKKAFGDHTDKPVEKLIDAWINDKIHIP